MKHAKQETAGLGDELANVMKGQMVLSTLKQIGAAVGNVMNEAADYTAKVAKNFIEAQKAMQAVSALAGVGNTNKFSLDMIAKARAANMTPADMTKFQESFLSAASNYVGNKPTAKLSQQEADKFQSSLAEFSMAKGVSPAAMADFAGKALAQEKGPTNAADMLAKVGKAYATVEASSAAPQHIIPGLTRVMAQGYSLAEAAPVLSMMPEIAPEEESTHLLRVLASTRELNLKGKGKEFGIEKGMRPAEQMEAMLKNLYDRTNKGTDEDELNKLIEQIVGGNDIAGNTIRGLVGKGPEGLKGWKDILANTSPDVVQQTIAADRETEGGKVRHSESELTTAEAQVGAQYAGVETLKKQAEADLTREGRFARPNILEDTARGAIGKANIFSQTTAREQLIQERAFDMAQEGAGIPASDRRPLDVGAGKEAANESIRALLERQNQLLEKQNVMMEKDSQTTLTVVPPAGPGRGGG